MVKNGQFINSSGEDDRNGIIAALSNPQFSDLIAFLKSDIYNYIKINKCREQQIWVL